MGKSRVKLNAVIVINTLVSLMHGIIGLGDLSSAELWCEEIRDEGTRANPRQIEDGWELQFGGKDTQVSGQAWFFFVVLFLRMYRLDPDLL